MPEKAHAHRCWPPMVTNNAQCKIISERKVHVRCANTKKSIQKINKIQSVMCKYIRATRIQHKFTETDF